MKVLVIDGHPLMQSAIKWEIKDHKPQAKVTLIGQIGQGFETIRNQFFDLIVIEIGISGGGMQAIREIRALAPSVKILIFSMVDESVYALPSVSSGANGFLSKDNSGEQLRIAVDMVLESKTYFSRAVQETLVSQIIANIDSSDHNPLQALTPRERLVANLLLQGNKVQQIAEILELKESTIRIFKTNIFKKLQVSDILALSKKAKMLR